MKKTLQLLSAFALTFFTVSQSNAQCTLSLAVTDTSVCLGDSTTITAVLPSTTLATTLAAGNNHRGNMFDIVAINQVTITGFDAHPQGNTDFEIYYKVGSYVGNHNNAGAWTLVGSATGVVAQPMGTATPIPIPINITIPAGQTYAFYVTSSNTGISLNYTDGSSAGSVYASDANIQFLEGVGLEYPFSGTPFSPRIWNGNIHYSIPGTTTTFSWNTGATTPSITVAPTDTTQYNLDVTMTGCPTLSDSVEIDVVGNFVDLGVDFDICEGDTVTIDGGIVGATYTWYDATTAQTIDIDTTTFIYVDVVDTFGCASTDSVQVSMNFSPIIGLGADSTICENEDMILNAGTGYTSYDWSSGDTTATSNVGNMALSPGLNTVTVEVLDANGCMGTDTVDITVNAAPVVDLGADTMICVYGTAVFDAGTGFTSYMWYDNSTGQTLNLDGSTLGVGTETVIVTVENSDGCFNSDTTTLLIDPCTGVEEFASNISVYPNPANAMINLKFENPSNAMISIVAADGQLVKQDQMNGKVMLSLDVTDLATGMYTVIIAEGNERFSKRLVINR